MTTLVSLTFGLIVLVWLVGMIVNGLFFQRSRDLHDADALAITLANKLNSQNRIGQINELQADSRELIYLSRGQFEECLEKEPLLGGLANQLLSEARDNHQLVENERAHLSSIVMQEVKEDVREFNKNSASLPAKLLPWIGSNNFQISDVKFGCIKNISSNIPEFDGYPELAQFDRSQGYITPGSNLFRSDVVIQLPVDSDIKFKLAALPACVKGVCAAARNTNDDLFVDSTRFQPDTIATALQITSGSQISVGNAASGKLELKSTAITAGASPSDR